MGYTSEYLSAFREKAKDLLPDWMVKRIHDAAYPTAGGRAQVEKAASPGSGSCFDRDRGFP